MSESRADHSKRHLSGCTFESFNDYAAKHVGEIEPPSDPEWGAQAGFALCEDGCPFLEEAKAYGRELAERFGW